MKRGARRWRSSKGKGRAPWLRMTDLVMRWFRMTAEADGLAVDTDTRLRMRAERSETVDGLAGDTIRRLERV